MPSDLSTEKCRDCPAWGRGVCLDRHGMYYGIGGPNNPICLKEVRRRLDVECLQGQMELTPSQGPVQEPQP
jgi:hypothetical protein